MEQPKPNISVIIATTCEAKRRESLRRAIDSVFTQEGVDVELIIVVNGDRFDAQMLKELKSNPNLKVHYLPEANVSAARKFGKSVASKEFFFIS